MKIETRNVVRGCKVIKTGYKNLSNIFGLVRFLVSCPVHPVPPTRLTKALEYHASSYLLVLDENIYDIK